MIRLALVGAGYWGEKWIRTIRAMQANGYINVRLVAIVDPDKSRRAMFSQEAPSLFASLPAFLGLARDSVDAVIVATPASTHVPIVLSLLDAGKHVLVEKPPALSIRGLRQLIAQKGDLVLMAGLTYLHHAGIEYMRDHMLADCEVFGEPLYARCRWTNDGIVRSNVDVAWNVLVHPLSILFDLFARDCEPQNVSWVSRDWLRTGRADYGVLSCSIGDCQVTIEVSWIDLVKRRDIWIRGGSQAVWFNELGHNLELYVSEIPALSLNWSFGSGLSPLERELRRFVRAIEHGEDCYTPIDCRVVRQITEVLEQVSGAGWEIWHGDRE